MALGPNALRALEGLGVLEHLLKSHQCERFGGPGQTSALFKAAESMNFIYEIPVEFRLYQFIVAVYTLKHL